MAITLTTGTGGIGSAPMLMKYEPKNAVEKAVFTRDPAPHPGWRQYVGHSADTLNALDAMGHTKTIIDRRLDFNEAHNPISEPDLYKLCSALFKRSLRGFPGATSQYGFRFIEFGHGYTPDVVEAMGTAKSLDLLKKQMVSILEELARTHPIIVWRAYPEISTEHSHVRCYMRFHVMTEEQYQHFAQNAD